MASTGNKLYIYGASTLGEIVLSAGQRAGLNVSGFVDDVITETTFQGLPVFGGISDLVKNIDVAASSVFVAIGDNSRRRDLCEALQKCGISLQNIVDPQAILDNYTTIGVNNFVMAGAYLGIRSEIGTGNLFFAGISLTHHNKVGNYNFFSPNCSVGGFTSIGDDCKIGMNAVVFPYINVSSGTTVEPLTRIQ